MKKVILLFLVITASLIIIRAFFMPWARVSTTVVEVSRQLTSSATGAKLMKFPEIEKAMKELERVTDVIEGLGDIEVGTTISGYDVPRMLSQKGSKVAISLMQILFEDTKDLDKKSFFVYLAPVLALVCVLLAVMGLRYRLPVLIMLILGGGLSISGLYNLKTADLSALPVNIVIGEGLWYTLYGYLFIFFVGVLWSAIDRGGVK